ncbi:MAG: hypothetical protein NVS4B8_01890 [Herpetosiphon sp.]
MAPKEPIYERASETPIVLSDIAPKQWADSNVAVLANGMQTYVPGDTWPQKVRSGWWIVVLTTLATLLGALCTAVITPPEYGVSGTFILYPSVGAFTRERSFPTTADNVDIRALVRTFAEALVSAQMFHDAALTLHLQPSEVEAYRRSARVAGDSHIIVINVVGPDPHVAALLANTIGERTTEYFKGLYQMYTVAQLDPPIEPKAPTTTYALQLAIPALLLGFLLGLLLVTIRDHPYIPSFVGWRYPIRSVIYDRAQLKQVLHAALIHPGPHLPFLGLVRLHGLQQLAESLPPVIAGQLDEYIIRAIRKAGGPSAQIGYWDGSTYALFLSNTESVGARHVLREINDQLSKPLFIDEQAAELDLDPQVVGIAAEPGERPGAFIERAVATIDIPTLPHGQVAWIPSS